MRIQSTMFALALAMTAAPLSAQVIVRDDPRDRRPSTAGGVLGDIIFGDGTGDRDNCRVRDARTPDGRIVQICDDRRDKDDSAYEHRRDGRGRRAHVHDRDGDGDFDARDRAIRKAEKDRLKALKKQRKSSRRND